jgi:hypothetical protein
MISHFLKLEWKQFVRSASFGKSIALKILMGFFALYFIICFLAIGVLGYYILKKQLPDSDPLQIVNSFLLYAILKSSFILSRVKIIIGNLIVLAG